MTSRGMMDPVEERPGSAPPGRSVTSAGQDVDLTYFIRLDDVVRSWKTA